MRIEYQLTFNHIQTMISEQLALAPLEPLQAIALPEGTLSFDHMELGDTRLCGHAGKPQLLYFQTDNGATAVAMRALRFEQDAVAHIAPIAREDEMADDVTVQTPLPLVLELDVWVELQPSPRKQEEPEDAPTEHHRAAIVVTLAGIVGLPGSRDSREIVELVSYRSVIPLEVDTLATLLGSRASISGAAMVASHERGVVGIRVQLGELTRMDEGQWARFLKGSVTPRLGGRSWAMFVDHDEQAQQVAANEQQTITAMIGANLLWRHALQRASRAALSWLALRDGSGRLLDLGDEPLAARHFEAFADTLEHADPDDRVLIMRLA